MHRAQNAQLQAKLTSYDGQQQTGCPSASSTGKGRKFGFFVEQLIVTIKLFEVNYQLIKLIIASEVSVIKPVYTIVV